MFADLAPKTLSMPPPIFVIPSAARNLLLAGSISAAGGQQVPQRLKPFRNDKG
jgi:hypothetical protein